MKEHTVKTWRGLRRVTMCGHIARQFTAWISRKIKEEGTTATFTLKEIMEAHGMAYDSRSDYSKAMGYFMKQRKAVETALLLFWESEEYKEYKVGGHTDDEIFEAMMKAAISYEIYPMWSDLDNHYKLLDLNGYLHMKEKRARSIATEIKATSRTLGIMAKEMPKLAERYKRPELPEGGMFIGLPEPQRFVCPFCGAKFTSEMRLELHMRKVHGVKS